MYMCAYTWIGNNSINVTGFWKTDRIVILGLFHFIGPANAYTCTLHIHSPVTGLGWLFWFSRVSFAYPVNSWLRQWDPWRALHGRHGCEIHARRINTIQACLGLWLALLGPIVSPNSSNRGFNPPSASHPPRSSAPPPIHPPLLCVISYITVVLKNLLKIQQCKLASSNSYKILSKILFHLYSISGIATV